MVFEGIMDAEFYLKKVLSNGLLLFVQEKLSHGYWFQQDNNLEHTSCLAVHFMEENTVNWWKTPLESPDLNLVENFWQELQHFLRNEAKPHTKMN